MNVENKMVVVINGKSGVGKDTLIELAAAELKVCNVSSVDPIRQIAYIAGWDGVKDDAWRKMMIDVKKALTEYNDFPTKYIIEKYNEFKKSNDNIMFVHIREPEEIRKLENYIPCVTLLVTRKMGGKFNAQDENLHKYKYDYIFENDKPLEESGKEFVQWLKERIEKIV